MARYETREGQNNKPQSKKGRVVWSSLSQGEAKNISKTFVNNANVKSALISGLQWDAMMAYIASKPRVDGNGVPFSIYTGDISRRRGWALNTGSRVEDKVCNIFDLEANEQEATAERSDRYSSQPIIVCGTYYNRIRNNSMFVSCRGECKWQCF